MIDCFNIHTPNEIWSIYVVLPLSHPFQVPHHLCRSCHFIHIWYIELSVTLYCAFPGPLPYPWIILLYYNIVLYIVHPHCCADHINMFQYSISTTPIECVHCTNMLIYANICQSFYLCHACCWDIWFACCIPCTALPIQTTMGVCGSVRQMLIEHLLSSSPSHMKPLRITYSTVDFPSTKLPYHSTIPPWNRPCLYPISIIIIFLFFQSSILYYHTQSLMLVTRHS